MLALGICESKFVLFVLYLATRFDTVCGVDIRKYDEKHPNLTIVVADIMHLPLHNNYFDVVIAISTIEHIGIGYYGDPIVEQGDRLAFKEIRRVLKEKGKVVVTVPAGKNYEVHNEGRVYSHSELISLFEPAHIDYFSKGFFPKQIEVNDLLHRQYKGKWALACIVIGDE